MQCQRAHENIRYDWSIGSLSLISPFPAELVMHIEFVTDTYPPDINGAAKTLSYLVTCLRTEGHKVTIMGPHPESELKMASVRVPKYASVNLGLITQSRLRKHWQKSRPDVIYIAGEAFLGSAAVKGGIAIRDPSNRRLSHQLRSVCGKLENEVFSGAGHALYDQFSQSVPRQQLCPLSP